MYDLSAKEETRITTSGSAHSPAIYGDRIVWRDWRNGYYDIYMYNLSTSDETQLTTNAGASHLAIFGDRIVWVDERNGNSDIYMGTLSSRSLIADFSASPISGDAPLNVTFTDKTKGIPTAWEWNFGDGENSTQQNPTHIYSKAGTYIVNLTVSNTNGTDSKTSEVYAYGAARESFLTFIPNFFSNNVSVIDTATTTVTATVNVGSVPIGVAVNPEGTRVYVANHASGNVYVIDTATNKVTATVDVGDYPLALGQFIGKKPAPELLLPVADSIANVTSGYVPLSVQFTDLSQNATSRSWDFNNDGISDSSGVTPVYVYIAPGTYTINLTVSNANGSASKLSTITVLTKSGSSGESSSSGSRSSGSSSSGSRSSGSSHRSGGSNGAVIVSSSAVSNSTGKTNATGIVINLKTILRARYEIT